MDTNWHNLHSDHFQNVQVLITGGAGFIGSHLCEVLLKLGARVRAMDDLSGGSRGNIDAFDDGSGSFQFIEGSILDEQVIKQAMAGCCCVFHQAALPSVPRSIKMPRRFHDVNVTGTQMVLDAAVAAGVQRVTFAASSSAYGDSETLPKIETMPGLPKSPYAANKLAGEHLMRAYANCYDIDTAVLRYFNIFGPRQNANSVYSGVIALFAGKLLAGEQPTIYGDGGQSRDFTYVNNAVHANLLAARRADPIGGEVINVACGKPVTISELAEKMAQMVGKPNLKAEHGPPRTGDVKHSLADLARGKAILGYEPIVDFEMGIERTVAWYESTMVA